MRGPGEVATEHVVGRDVDQSRTDACAGLSDVFGASGVDRLGGGFVGLGSVDIGIGSTVDDHVTRLDEALGGVRVGDIPVR
jgi:hypothetical protein